MKEDKKPVMSDAEAEGARIAGLYRAELKFDEIVALLAENHPHCVVPKSTWVH
jgi:hypothetical protein